MSCKACQEPSRHGLSGPMGSRGADSAARMGLRASPWPEGFSPEGSRLTPNHRTMFPQATPARTPAEQRSTLPSRALNKISPLGYAHTDNAPLSPLESAVSLFLSFKSLGISTYRKSIGGYPLPSLPRLRCLCPSPISRLKSPIPCSAPTIPGLLQPARGFHIPSRTRVWLRLGTAGQPLYSTERPWYVGEAAPQDFPTRPRGPGREPHPFAGAPRLARDKRFAPLAGSFQREEKTHEQQARA